MKSIVLNTGTIVFITLFIVGCNDSEPLSLSEEQRVSVPNKDIYSIQLKPGMNKQLKIGLPVSLTLADKLRVPGRIEPDEETLVRIGANVT